MINNHEDFDHVSKQLKRLETILADLRNRLLPHNAQMYELMASGYVQRIAEFRKEIDFYLGIQESQDEVRKADFVVRLVGPAIGSGTAPISVVSHVLDELRKGFQDIYAYNLGYRSTRKLPVDIQQKCDMSLSALMVGSLQVALQRPLEQITLFSEESDFDKTAQLYLKAAKWACEKTPTEVIKQELPNDELRDVIMKSVLRIIPKNSKKLNLLHIYGPLVKENIYLNVTSRNYLINNISNKSEEEVICSFKGRIREVDLDKGSFRMRDISDDENTVEVIGFVNETLLDDLKEALDELAIIKGVLIGENTYTKSLKVRYIEKL